MINKILDKKLRIRLVEQAGYSLDEIPLVYRYINGDDEALAQLSDFRQWKKEREFIGFNPLSPPTS